MTKIRSNKTKLLAKSILKTDTVQQYYKTINDGFSIPFLPAGIAVEYWRSNDSRGLNQNQVTLIDYFGWQTLEEAREKYGSSYLHLPLEQRAIAVLTRDLGFEQSERQFQVNSLDFIRSSFFMQIYPSIFMGLDLTTADLLLVFVFGGSKTRCDAQHQRLTRCFHNNLFKDFFEYEKKYFPNFYPKSLATIRQYLKDFEILPFYEETLWIDRSKLTPP